MPPPLYSLCVVDTFLVLRKTELDSVLPLTSALCHVMGDDQSCWLHFCPGSFTEMLWVWKVAALWWTGSEKPELILSLAWPPPSRGVVGQCQMSLLHKLLCRSVQLLSLQSQAPTSSTGHSPCTKETKKQIYMDQQRLCPMSENSRLISTVPQHSSQHNPSE